MNKRWIIKDDVVVVEKGGTWQACGSLTRTGDGELLVATYISPEIAQETGSGDGYPFLRDFMDLSEFRKQHQETA